MKVSKVVISNFTKHASTAVELPEVGVVAITGANGEGKSSLIEAVAWATWGETLRGSPPYVEGRECRTSVVSDKVHVERSRVTNKTGLKWSHAGAEPEVFENVTKSQAALEAIVGPFNVWRRTSVFSSQDAAHFTMASDAERKRLLEAILALERFDLALERARAARKKTEDKAMLMSRTVAAAQAKLESEHLRVRDAKAVLDAVPAPVDVKVMEGVYGKAARAASGCASDIQVLLAKQRSVDREVAGLEATARETARRLALLSGGICDKCQQPIPESLTTALRQQVKDEDAGAAKARAHAEQIQADLQAQIDDLRAESAEWTRRQIEAQNLVTAERSNAARRDHAQKALAAAQASVSTLEASLAHATAQAALLDKELAVLQAVELVVGLKGVRAHVLGKALSGVESIANAWLARLAGPHLQLNLKPYLERKDGKLTDSISLEVLGAGGGHGYYGASSGERRRIDLALLFALAEVAAASTGREPGTLFVDECFDALDAEGIEAAAVAIGELAQTRCVVVITHQPSLVRRLNPSAHYEVKAGRMVQARA